MHVVAAPDRAELATKLAETLEAPSSLYERKVFPDGERFVQVPQALEGQVVVLGDLRPNEQLVELLIACDATREAGAEHVTLAVPYMAYARQDRAFEQGEGVSARAVCRALGSVADALVTVDVHTEAILAFFGGSATSELANVEIARALGDRGVDLVLAPDAGARDAAQAVAKRLDARADHLEKTRVSSTKVQMAPKELDVAGATVAIVDDIISTGGTMATATGHLLEAGAERVLVAATHGIFVDGADKRLDDAGVDEVLVTDTIPSDRSVISCDGALARGLQRLQGS